MLGIGWLRNHPADAAGETVIRLYQDWDGADSIILFKDSVIDNGAEVSVYVKNIILNSHDAKKVVSRAKSGTEDIQMSWDVDTTYNEGSSELKLLLTNWQTL